MRISAVNSKYSTINQRRLRENTTPTIPIETTPETQNGLTFISFKSGNKGDILHVVGECKPFAQVGGVATVVQDYQTLNNISSTEKGRTVVVTPFYNGLVRYECPEGASGLQKLSVDLPRVPEGLPDGHPFKDKVGQPIYIKGKTSDLSKTTIKEALEKGKDYWLLEEVAEKTMTWGMEKDAPIKLLKVKANAEGKDFTNDVYMIFSEATAYDLEPYSKGQYSSKVSEVGRSWNGDPYAKFNKAVVECMEDITRHSKGFDPGTVVCSDAQAAYVTHYMAQKQASGSEYFKGKKPIQIGHNLGDGYIGITSPRNMLINLDLLKPNELEALTNSENLKKALVKGNGAEDEYLKQFFESFNAKNKFSAMSIPAHYGKNGYLTTLGVVSKGYLDEAVTNKEIAPFLYEDLKELKEAGVAIGLTNPHNSENTAFTKVGLPGYNSEQKIKLADGTEEIIKPLRMLTEADKEGLTLEKLRTIKKENKINFLNRFLPKYEGAQLFDPKTNKWGSSGTGTSMIRKGMAGEMPVVQSLDINNIIKRLNAGEDIKVVVSWGRGDFQKAFDEVLTGFKKYVQNTGDKDTILILGGDLAVDKQEGQKIKDLAELFSKDNELKGRIMLLDDFAPGEPMAWIADASNLPSRTAPCELTDLESKKFLCTPLVAKGQGLGQKNFDPAIAEDALMADAFKTKLQYFDSRESFLKVASDETKEKFNKVFDKLKTDYSTQYRVSIGKEISPEQLEIFISANPDYQEALRKLRDDVMTDDIAKTLERCLIENRNSETAEIILKNQVNIQTAWENNAKIIRSDVPSGELYRQIFRKDNNPVDAKKLIGEGKDFINEIINQGGNTSSGVGGGGNTTPPTKKGNKLLEFFKSKTGKIALGVAAGLAIIGAGYHFFKKSKAPSSNAVAPTATNITKRTEGQTKNLSAVV